MVFRSRHIVNLGKSLLGLLMVVLGSCIPDPLEVTNIPTLPVKLVIASQALPDRGLSVLVTTSIGALDAGWGSELEPLMREIAVDDAVITLEHENQIDTLVHQLYGVYTGSGGIIEAGKIYTLRVRSVRWGEVTAVETAPEYVPFQSASAKLYLTGYDSLASVTYSLQDPPDPNWYMINVQKISSTTPVDRYLNPRVFTRLVRDSSFNGQRFEESFNVIFQNYSLDDSVLVTMANISEAYYHYLKVRNDSRYSLAGFASEPLNFPSNVKGGYGYFNLHLPDARVFVMK